jgi:hypothetical protein
VSSGSAAKSGGGGSGAVPCHGLVLWAGYCVGAAWHGCGCGRPLALALHGVGLAGVVAIASGGCWCGQLGHVVSWDRWQWLLWVVVCGVWWVVGLVVVSLPLGCGLGQLSLLWVEPHWVTWCVWSHWGRWAMCCVLGQWQQQSWLVVGGV